MCELERAVGYGKLGSFVHGRVADALKAVRTDEKYYQRDRDSDEGEQTT